MAKAKTKKRKVAKKTTVNTVESFIKKTSKSLVKTAKKYKLDDKAVQGVVTSGILLAVLGKPLKRIGSRIGQLGDKIGEEIKEYCE